MLSKTLEGAVVERVYYAVVIPTWLPVIGEPFETYEEAKAYALLQMQKEGRKEALIVSRLVFGTARGVKDDMEFDRDTVYL